MIKPIANYTNNTDAEQLKKLAINLFFNEIKTESLRERFLKYVKNIPIVDQTNKGYYCTECKKFSKIEQMPENMKVIRHWKNGYKTFTDPSEIWIVKTHYDGCYGWD